MKERKTREPEPLYDLESGGDDNLYTLPEEGEEKDSIQDSRSEESVGNVSEYEEEDDDEEEDDEEEEDNNVEESGNKSVIGLMFKILSTPVEGWKELKRRGYTPEKVASGCFFPMIGFASFSEIANKFYTTISLGECVMNAFFTFFSFFFSYFTIMLFGAVMLPAVSKISLKKDIGKEFVMINLSTLALFYAANELFPMIDAALFFLPIWTVYLIYKGVRILRVPVNVESRTKIILVFLIIGMPLFWQWLLQSIFK